MSTAITLVKINVGLVGMPPGLLMSSKRIMEAPAGGPGAPGGRRTPEEEAELHCHWTTVGKKKQLAIPWTNLYKCFCQAATHFTWKGRTKFTDILAATITCSQDMITLGTNQYEVYQEWVRIPPKTGAMVKIARPRLREWSCLFQMLVDPDMYGKHGVGILKDIITHAGKMVGIGPWRPSLKGPYGKFAVDCFEIIE